MVHKAKIVKQREKRNKIELGIKKKDNATPYLKDQHRRQRRGDVQCP